MSAHRTSEVTFPGVTLDMPGKEDGTPNAVYAAEDAGSELPARERAQVADGVPVPNPTSLMEMLLATEMGTPPVATQALVVPSPGVVESIPGTGSGEPAAKRKEEDAGSELPA